MVWPRLTLRVGGVKLSGINKRRFKNGLVLYTDTFGPSTGTSPAGLEAVVRDGSVAELLADAGDAELPAGGAVLSAAGTRVADLRRLAAVGRPLRLTTTLASRGRRGGRRPPALPLRGCSYISAGPALILRGQLLSRAQQLREGRRIANRRFVGRRHPRTAVGIRRGGRTVLLVTVDGRQEGSAGMSLPELARFLRRQGAREAYNLDGGGSTTMVLKGRVANTPSDLLGRERRVSDALVVLGRL